MRSDHARHVELFCGQLSHTLSKLERDPTAEALAIDLLSEDKIFDPLQIPKSIRDRIHFVPFDCADLTFEVLRDLVRKHLNCTLKQVSTYHASPPCTTYSLAHHNKNPHRKQNSLEPRPGKNGDLARAHDKLNDIVLTVLRDVSRKVYSPVISIENPQNLWQYLDPVKALLNVPGWHKHTADHCSNLAPEDDVFPRKRSTWLLFNCAPDIPLNMCNKNCACLIPGTGLHKLVVCTPTRHEDQVVLTTPEEQGRIRSG